MLTSTSNFSLVPVFPFVQRTWQNPNTSHFQLKRQLDRINTTHRNHVSSSFFFLGAHNYHVALTYKSWLWPWGDDIYIGSGALINHRWLVTSARVAKQINWFSKVR